MSTGALGSIVNSVVDAAFDQDSGTNLTDFLSKFGSAEGKLVNTIDPLATFETSIKFYPCPSAETGNKSRIVGRVTNALGTAATGALRNAANNITGGLLGSLLNDLGGNSVASARDSFTGVGKHSFMEYLAQANMLVGGENWFNIAQSNCPLELQLGFYVQNVTVPMIHIPDVGKTITLLGEFPINGQYAVPDSNLLVMSILNTKLPLHERIFYPWMREVTLPYWSYNTQPYTTATITIDFSKHMDIQYVFYGCRPCQIHTVQPAQDPSSGAVTRDVSFMFDFMFITSKEQPVMESTVNKLLSAGKTLFNGAAKMLNA